MRRAIFITGTNRGLGLSLTAKFLREGFRVFAGTRSNSHDLQQLTKEFPKSLNTVPLDVTDMGSIRQAGTTISQHVDTLDILINNAGIYAEQDGSALEHIELTTRYLQQPMDVNAFGPLRVTQQLLPLLGQGQRKLIVNVSSEAGSIADCWRDWGYAYCMSKAALNMQSKILQNHLGPKGYKVLAVHPGWMQTDMGGPDASIHPDEAAEGIFALTQKSWQPDDPIYMNYKGSAMRW
jgi:NAD(P)-dependent dehydrogenase (short-subunit alcohol dehydrogenase family)